MARRRLEEDRRRLAEQHARLRQSGLEDAETGGIGELSLYDQHPADLGSELAARQNDAGLMQNIDRLLEQVERALKRIDEGTYGVCERCGRPIGKKRLEAIPYASTCIACQQREDEARDGPGAPGGRPWTGRSDRPVEEKTMTPPFGRAFGDDVDTAAYDGEDTWQDVARHGTSNTPSDEPKGLHPAGAAADEDVGAVEPVEAVIGIGGRGVSEADIFPDPDQGGGGRRRRPPARDGRA